MTVLALGALLFCLFIASRLVFLAQWKVGAIVYYSNVIFDFFPKKIGIPRWAGEVGLFILALLLLWAYARSFAAVISVSFVGLLLELIVRLYERHILVAAYTRACKPPPYEPNPTLPLHGFPSPSVVPDLTIFLEGPFVSRRPRYDLGDLIVGRIVDLHVVVANHTLVQTPGPVNLEVRPDKGIAILEGAQANLEPLPSARLHKHRVRLKVKDESSMGLIYVGVKCADHEWGYEVQYRATQASMKCISVSIKRYPGARRSAFAWRGDMDLYDKNTLQSVDGLQRTLEFARRLMIPQTMFLSTRLSVDEEGAREFHAHFGTQRGQEEILEFVRFIRERCRLVHWAQYPVEMTEGFVLEVGNHGHLHYGTDTAPHEGNRWRRRAKMGAGRYPWSPYAKDSFEEQRDNAIRARQLIEELWNYTPRSWAMPDRARDKYTPLAMEAAGCEVLSDSDATTLSNVVFQPPPHHPEGVERAVELTKRYPGDPQHVFHLAMLRYMIHRGLRLGIPVIFMCHQHMRRFDGPACERFTEAILREVLGEINQDMWVANVYAVGKYFGTVLSEKTKKVEAALVEGGKAFVVTNASNLRLEGIPVDLEFEGGGRSTYLVDLPPKSKVTVYLATGTEVVESLENGDQAL